MSSTKSSAQRRSSPADLPLLTAARFFAAVWVVAYHYGGSLFERGTVPWTLVSNGFIGVSFFFTLSGFVLYHSYSGRFPIDARSFAVARAARIYPIYLLAWLASAPAVIAARMAKDASALVLTAKLLVASAVNVTLLQAWAPFLANAWNYPSWSISTEIFLYAAFLIVLPALRTKSVRELTWYLLLAGLAAAVLGCLSDFTLRHYAFSSIDAQTGTAAFLKRFPPLHLAQFIVGASAAALLNAGGAKLLRWAAVPAVLFLGWSVTSLGETWTISLNNGLLALPFAAIITALASFRRKGLALGILTLLGEASYALYLFQDPVHQMCERWIPLKSTSISFIAFLSVLIGVSLLVHRYIEKPAREWVKARFAAGPQKAPIHEVQRPSEATARIT